MDKLIYTRVLSIISNVFPDCTDIENATFKSLQVDSFALVQLILTLEETFGFEFEEDQMSPDNFPTMGHLAQYVEKRAANGSGEKLSI